MLPAARVPALASAPPAAPLRPRRALSVGLFVALSLLAPPLAAQTTYHALIIANDEGAAQNDDARTALRNWNSWRTNGTITLLDDRTGAQILTDIGAWVAGIDGDDVAIFWYIGHGGIQADAAAAGADELNNDPVKDNDTKRKVDEILGRNNQPAASYRTDDDVKAALGVLPSSTTLLTIFDMCYANGNAGGTSDRAVLTNTAVIAACPEATPTNVFFGWTPTAIKGLFDGNDANALADADANGNGEITVQEFFAYADAAEAATLLTSNLAGVANRPICTGLNNMEVDPANAPPGAAKKQTLEGHGDGSRMDFGDLPESFGTSLAANGPRYDEWVLQRLGSAADGDDDGQPGANGMGDDADSEGDDEDGVVFNASGFDVSVLIDHPDAHDYRLDVWFDCDGSGTFDEPAEHIVDSQTSGFLAGLNTGTHLFSFSTVPYGFDPRTLASRFRLTFGIDVGTPILAVGRYDAGDGGAHGEVEDYAASMPNPNPGLAYCFGDGLDPVLTTPCPCGNFGAFRHGCSSSFNPNGALLAATGSIAADNVTLQGSEMNATGFCVFLKGDANAATGLVFGDGVRCATGALIRLRTVSLFGGAANYPVSGETVTLSQRSQTPPGSGLSAYYTVFYRNASAAFCPPLTFNASNGWKMTW